MEAPLESINNQHVVYTPPSLKEVSAVIVVFQPNLELIKNVEAIRQQVDRIVIVDNGSSEEALIHLRRVNQVQGIETIWNANNLGVAAALNQGVQRARELGFEWVLTLDQDSRPAKDMVQKLWAVYQNQAESDRIAIVAPQVIDADLDRRAPFLRRKWGFIYERVLCENVSLKDVTTVITSGALMRISAFETIGGFREDFFIDYVDTEFCLRAQLHGYKIIAACQAKLEHRLGNRKKVKVGPFTLMPTFHPPWRWYTINRNRIPMLKLYALRFPHWLVYELVATMYVLLRMLLTEDKRGAKLRAAIRGTWHGLRGWMGAETLAI